MSTMALEQARIKRTIRCGVLSVVIAVIILLFVFLVLRDRHVRVRVASSLGPVVEGLRLNYSSANPSFSMSLKMQLNIRNPNFGHYKFENTKLTVLYRGIHVGLAVIDKGKAKAFSTKKVKLMVAINSNKVASRNVKYELRKNILAGVVTVKSQAKLTGKVHLLEIFKKKKQAGMKCVMVVNIKSKTIQNLKCHRNS